MEKRRNGTPRVSIGIPIYKGEIFLEQTLQSIFAQDFKDFEIIITDNNPGGKVEQIATKWASESKKIRYIKHINNLGALQNWNSIIQYVTAEYFIYAGAHDLWTSNLLTQLVTTLDHNKHAVLAYAPSYWIDQEGKSLDGHTSFLDMSGLSVMSRFNILIWAGQDALYGLMRISAVRQTRLQLEIVGSGAVWLSELSIFGEFVINIHAKRLRRVNRNESTREERLSRYHHTLFSKPRKRILPHWRIPLAYLGAAMVGNIRITQRIQLVISGFASAVLRYGNQMGSDIWSLLIRISSKFSVFKKR